METLRIVIPGLYGYRLDTPRPYDGNKLRSLDGGNYWGSIGQDPVLDRIAEVEEVIGQRNVVPGELAMAMNISVPEATQLLSLRQNKHQLLQRHSGSGEYPGLSSCCSPLGRCFSRCNNPRRFTRRSSGG